MLCSCDRVTGIPRRDPWETRNTITVFDCSRRASANDRFPPRSRHFALALRMALKGHEYQFPPPNLSAGCGFSKQTFAGMAGKEEDAPIPDLAFSGAVSGSAIADLQFS